MGAIGLSTLPLYGVTKRMNVVGKRDYELIWFLKFDWFNDNNLFDNVIKSVSKYESLKWGIRFAHVDVFHFFSFSPQLMEQNHK